MPKAKVKNVSTAGNGCRSSFKNFKDLTRWVSCLAMEINDLLVGLLLWNDESGSFQTPHLTRHNLDCPDCLLGLRRIDHNLLLLVVDHELAQIVLLINLLVNIQIFLNNQVLHRAHGKLETSSTQIGMISVT